MNSNVSEQRTVTELKEKIQELTSDLQESHNHTARLCVIQEVAQSLTSELNLEPLLHKILGLAVEVMEASAGSLLLFDELTDELVFSVVEGGGGDRLEGVRMPAGQGIAGWVAGHRQPLIIDDVNQDNRYYRSVAQSLDVKLTSLLCVPMVSHNKLIGVLQVLHSTSGKYFDEVEQQLLTAFANQAAIAIENARLYENLKEERDRLVVVEDNIRKRLARDLHDGPTQMVASMVMSLDFIKGLVESRPDMALNEVGQATTAARKALKQLRTLLFDLRPIILETQGLVPALDVYVERLRKIDDFNLKLTVEKPFARLTPKAEVAIFAVVQEAINNAKKHAAASQIDLVLRPDPVKDVLTVLIKDNGQGFDVHLMKDSYDERGSLGLINMQERTDVINGTFTIHSEVGLGTDVILSLPLSENLLDERDK